MAIHRSWAVLALAAVLAASAGFLLLPTTRSSAQIEEGATMTVLRGQVAVVHPDGSAVQPAPSGTVVNPGDEVRTLGSTSALITFFAGTEIELDQNTIIAIEQVTKQGDRIDISLRQVFGTTVNRVQTIGGSGSTYRVEAGGAVALVRGTTFVMIGPITTSAGNIVILVCGADCGPASSFAGCPLQPFLGYGVLVDKGRVESPCIPFAVSHTADLTSTAYEAVTTIEQQLQGDTHGVPAGQVQSGQQQEIESRNRRREEEDGDKSNEASPPSASPTVAPSPSALPTVSINDVSVPEGRSATFTVTLSAPSSQPVTVNFATANGTATAPGDYTATSGTLTIPAGATTGTIVVPTIGDTVVEPPESFTVNLSGAANATIADAQGVGTIVDAATLTLSVNDVTATEGSNATFTVTLSAPSSQPVTINFATANGTATAPGDYTPVSGTLTFPPGTTTQTIVVPIINDTAAPASVGVAAVEPPETFFVNLSDAVGATIADAQGVGTIIDTATLALSINDVSVPEASGPATFTVSLSAPSSQPVTVNFATANGTAVAPGDYAATSGTLTFPPNTTSRTIDVPIVNDAIDEPNETFVVNLSGATVATIADAQGVGTIVDDDPPPTISINDVSVTEGTGTNPTATFTVSISGASGQTITVDFATANGPASGGATGGGSCSTAGVDYISQSGTLTFPPGTTTQPVGVTICGDAIDELDETFFVNLANPTNATIADPQGVGTIVDDDTASLSINDVSQNEGNACTGEPPIFPPCGTTPFTFTVTLSNPSDRTVTVNFTTSDGGGLATATGGASGSCEFGSSDGGIDYEITSGILTFAAGTLSQPVTVPVCADQSGAWSLPEGDETFFVDLSSATGGATIADPRGQGTIIDDDTTF